MFCFPKDQYSVPPQEINGRPLYTWSLSGQRAVPSTLNAVKSRCSQKTMMASQTLLLIERREGRDGLSLVMVRNSWKLNETPASPREWPLGTCNLATGQIIKILHTEGRKNNSWSLFSLFNICGCCYCLKSALSHRHPSAARLITSVPTLINQWRSTLGRGPDSAAPLTPSPLCLRKWSGTTAMSVFFMELTVGITKWSCSLPCIITGCVCTKEHQLVPLVANQQTKCPDI
jgi:hypothetical protein